MITFDGIKNKHNECRAKDRVKKCCDSLKEHAVQTVNFMKKRMIPLTEQELQLYASQENCFICREKFKEGDADDRKYVYMYVCMYFNFHQ